MNTALADAAVLNELLDEYDDDWERVLPAFSQERVKEGNALMDLSFHSFLLPLPMQMSILVRQNVRRVLNKIFPVWLVEPEPMLEIISRGARLSVAYDKMIKLGYLRINNEIMQEHFEKTTGMVKSERQRPSRLWRSLLVVPPRARSTILDERSDLIREAGVTVSVVVNVSTSKYKV